MFMLLTLMPINVRAADFDKLLIPKDKVIGSVFGAERGKHIVPNEDRYTQFAIQAKFAQGVLLSVGTFRTLAVASFGQFSHVVLFDVDPGIVDFNKLQIEALKQSPTAADFLAKLIHRPQYVGIFKMILSNSSKRAEALAVFEDFYFRESKKRHDNRARRDFDLAPNERYYWEALEYVDKLLKYSATDAGQSFLTNHRNYNKIRKLEIGRAHV